MRCWHLFNVMIWVRKQNMKTSLFQALVQWGRSKKRAGDERDLISLPDPAGHPPAFSIVLTDREPKTGCVKSP